MWKTAAIVPARMDAGSHMASKEAEEPEVPKVVTAYAHKRKTAEPCGRLHPFVPARKDAEIHMASKEAEEPEVPKGKHSEGGFYYEKKIFNGSNRSIHDGNDTFRMRRQS